MQLSIFLLAAVLVGATAVAGAPVAMRVGASRKAAEAGLASADYKRDLSADYMEADYKRGVGADHTVADYKRGVDADYVEVDYKRDSNVEADYKRGVEAGS